jgi:hypothetical protein
MDDMALSMVDMRHSIACVGCDCAASDHDYGTQLD